MNKTQLVDCIQAKLGEDATKKCAEAALTAVLGAITDAVKGGDKVQLIGFGTFEAKVTGEREGRNPRTGETIKIAACKKPAFAASKALKDQIN